MNNLNQNIPQKNTFFNFKVSILEAFLYFLITIIVGQIVSGVITFPTFIFPELSMILLPFSFLAGFGLVLLILFKIKNLGKSDFKEFLKIRLNPIPFLIAIILYITALPLAEYLSMLVPIDGHPVLEELWKFFEEAMKIVLEEKVAAFIMVCILAPILEEFIFRGIILRGMLQNGINPWLAVILSALLFGMAHMNPWQLMGAGFLGFIFGIVYWRTQSLVLCMFLHFLNNFIAYIVTVYNNNLEEAVFEPNFMLIVGSIIATVCMITFFIIKTKQTALHS